MPRPVRPGSRLAVVAPAGPFDEEAFCAGISWLRERYEVVHRPDIFERTGYLAGHDGRRLAELLEALSDPSIDAIVCARGGFGATRLLPGIPTAAVREADKAIVGFSDITALHALWAAAGVPSVHAPMVAALGRATAEIRACWIEAVESPETPRCHKLRPLNAPSRSAGRLLGGNLAVLGALLGTPFQPNLVDCVLFLEDVGERPYRIDRVLTSMRQAGLFDGLRGLVLGAFTEAEPGPDGVATEDVFLDHFADAPFPVLAGFPAGHIDENEAIPFGRTVRIEGDGLLLGEAGAVDIDPGGQRFTSQMLR
jgi:muramoyltetrapeptide carboxypeptidase